MDLARLIGDCDGDSDNVAPPLRARGALGMAALPAPTVAPAVSAGFDMTQHLEPIWEAIETADDVPLCELHRRKSGRIEPTPIGISAGHAKSTCPKSAIFRKATADGRRSV